jgi:hypothetical protein
MIIYISFSQTNKTITAFIYFSFAYFENDITEILLKVALNTITLTSILRKTNALILTKLGTYLVLKRIWNPIDF